MIAMDTADLVGEVHCLNCGRTLAEAIRSPLSGKLRLRPAPHQPSIIAKVVDGRSLQCLRCQGKAFIEPVSRMGLQVAPARDSIRPMVGAA